LIAPLQLNPLNMNLYTFKNNGAIQKSFYASDVFAAKKMAFNYFKTNLIELI